RRSGCSSSRPPTASPRTPSAARASSPSEPASPHRPLGRKGTAVAASLSAVPPRPLWRRAASLAPFLAGGLLLLLMFGVPGFIVNTSHSEIGAEAAFGTADGREVLVIGYEDTGFSGLWMLAGETSGE